MIQKMEKKERKKEKKRQKKAAQLGENERSDHHSKHGHKKRKHDGRAIVDQDTRKVDTVEHLEKSSLSEEHEAPSYNQALRCTPESSLDSSKKLRVNLCSNPSQTRNGVFRLKLAPSSQQRDPVTTAGMSMKPRLTEQLPVQEIRLMAHRHREFNPHVNTVTAVKQLVSQQKNMAQRNGNFLGESRQASQQNAANLVQRVNTVQRVSTESTPKTIRRVDPHSSENVVMQIANPAATKILQGFETAPVKAVQRDGHLIPPEIFQGESTKVPADLLRKATVAALLGELNMERLTLLNKPKACADPPALLNRPKLCVEIPVVKQQHQTVPPANEEPCSVESVLGAASAKEFQHSTPNSDQKICKVEKKERKLADLFVNWKPLPIQMEDTDAGGQDWLFSCAATPRSNCRTFDGSAWCQPTEQLFSLQPRAVHLPDLHLYQLPFAVPF
ncbi:hypothetical protein GUJ93_ZPchr0010g7375 [Zizania palustris]|uniref:Uncharacterized protein n=1 Tax=Zizania palustris TaxID=103762 RepID=A0A8J6BNF5_ZIZPA|nr:hypothetical protein GUJ93_ZPchr0010g7375 [Zizania palustris]